MKARIFAWSLLLLLLFGAYTFASKFKNPWASPVSPVLAILPLAAPGCGADCK